MELGYVVCVQSVGGDLKVGEEQVLQSISVGRDGLRQLSKPASHEGEEPQDAGL